jgi:hypothetical protein
MKNQCQPSDLRAVNCMANFWYVDDDGNAEDFAFEGDVDRTVDEYMCVNCGEYFIPAAKYESDALAVAWQEALEHCQDSAEAERTTALHPAA